METEVNVLVDVGATTLPDVEDVLKQYGQSAEIVGEYDIPDEGDRVEMMVNGRVRVTKTTRVLVRVTPPDEDEQDEVQTVNQTTVAKPPLSPSEENKEFYLQMERERKKIIAVQRRSTPADLAANYLNAINSDMNGQLQYIDGEYVDPGEVDSQSILDNKDSTKKFLINKMLEGSQNNNDTGIEIKETVVKTEAKLSSSKKVNPQPKMATPITTNGMNGNVHPPAVAPATLQQPVVNGKQDQMHLVEAKLCFIDQAATLPSFNGIKREKSTSTIITESKIAQEIEECRMREEELKLQRFERSGRTEEQDSVSSKEVFRVEKEIVPVIARANIVESTPIKLEKLYHSLSMSDISGHASVPEPATPEILKQSSVDEDFVNSRIRVRPLHDDSDDDDKPMYMVYKESAVEREIRLASEKEEALRREKSQRELDMKGTQKQEQSPVILKDVSILKDLKQVAAINLTGVVTDSSSVDKSSPKSEVFQTTLEVSVTKSPSLETQVLERPLIEAPVQNGYVSLIQKRSGPNLTLPTSKSHAASRITEQNMASARLQEEVNEMIQKELALKESGSIATTSQDRIDDKVINIRQYKVERSPNTVVPQSATPQSAPLQSTLTQSALPQSAQPQSAPPKLAPSQSAPSQLAPPPQSAPPQSAPPYHTTPPNFKEATITSNGSSFSSISRQVSYAGQANVAPRTALYRSNTTKGIMARFINSKGKMSAMPVFVPKVTKPAPLEVITNPAPHATSLETSTSLHQTQVMNAKEEDTISVISSEHEQVLPKPEILTYRRNYSLVENKILSELRDMKEREEELRQQRTAHYRRNSRGSLESLLESEDSGETHGQLESPNGFDGTFNFAKDYDSDNSLEHQTYLQGSTRKQNYWINQWEERIQQNES